MKERDKVKITIEPFKYLKDPTGVILKTPKKKDKKVNVVVFLPGYGWTETEINKEFLELIE